MPAPTVEHAVRDLPVRRWLGLTATPKRPDGLKEIMIMQCGPIRHRIPHAADTRPRTLHIHPTDLRVTAPTDGLSGGEILGLVHAALVEDPARTGQICADVARSMRDGRNCLVLSGRTEHVETLADTLRGHSLDPLVLHGRLKPAERRAIHHRLDSEDQLLLVATDRYIGEGFDCPRLDTLFLTFPVSATTRITQYVGRILRDHPGKRAVDVHDYLDADAPMLPAMYRRRRGAYTHLGYTQGAASEQQQHESTQDNHREPKRSRGPTATSAPAAAAEPTAAQVRAWARNTGRAVADRGRIRAHIWHAHHAAHL